MSDATAPLPPMWLSHHETCEADRCLRIGDRFVCRRCLFMFAGFFPALALLLSSWADDLQAGDIGLVLALTLLAAGEFVQVARGEMTYSARRVMVLSPATGAVLAWLGVTGFREGIAPVHVVAGVAALGLLVLLAVRSRSRGNVPTAA